MKEILVFDFDGTLIDSMGHLADIAAQEMKQVYGISFEMARHLYLLTSGIPFVEQLELIFPTKKENQGIVDEFEKNKADRLLEEPLFPEVREVFGKLTEMGYQLVISTSNFKELAEAYLNDRGLKVDLILGYKPGFNKGKDHFEYIENYYEVSADQLVFIGDSLQDFKRAQASAITFIGRISTFTAEEMQNVGVKYFVENLSQLEKVLKQVDPEIMV